MAIAFSGLASGLDTDALVKAILDVERQPVVRLESRRSSFDRSKAAFAELGGKLRALESALADLSTPSRFRAKTVSVSSETAIRASAGSSAELGLFDINIQTLATASKVKSDAVADSEQGLVSAGTITLQSGSNDPVVIDVNEADGTNSLSAIRDAINAADSGIQAAVLFDGSGYRLTVRSEETGLANALTVTDGTNLNLDDTVNNGVTAAGDATLTIDGIDITSASNTITTALSGVTLDLLTTTEPDSVTVEVGNDIDQAVENVQELIEKYNELTEFFNSQFQGEQKGPLSGDSTAVSIQSKIQSLFTSGISGIEEGGIRALSSIGVSFEGRTGIAELDTGTLRELLSTDFDGVGDLFLASGTATDPRANFLASGRATVAGTYALDITQAAERAQVSGGTGIISLDGDETLTISDGTTSIDVSLTTGQSSAQVVDAINAALSAAGVNATANDSSGALNITSTAFGASATVSVTSDRADGLGTGFTTTTSSDAGLDVQGTIGGSAATGVGQVLTADEGDATGLAVRITATSSVVASLAGDLGEVSFSRGLVSEILQDVDQLTRSGDGPVELAQESLQSRIDQIDDDIVRIEDRLTIREQQLLRRFAQAEQAISSLNSQQSAFSAF